MSAGSDDLLIVGAGMLGRFIAAEWQKLHPNAKIIGETRTETHHEELSKIGISPALANSTEEVPPQMAFCAPPSGATDYPEAVREAFARAAPETRVVFTSSGSVHGTAEFITEATPTGDDGRAGVLAAAERNTTDHPNGLVVRLSGLYTLDRGAHSYWLKTGVVKAPAEGTLNLIHYADAAHAVVLAILAKRDNVYSWPKRTLLAAARKYVTRKQCCEVALRHPIFSEMPMPEFPSTEQPTSRSYDNEWTRTVLGWSPKWESFEQFILEEIAVNNPALMSDP